MIVAYGPINNYRATKLFEKKIKTSPLLDKGQLSEQLNISVKTIDKLMAGKEIPYIKMGKSVRFRWEDIDAWIETRSQECL